MSGDAVPLPPINEVAEGFVLGAALSNPDAVAVLLRLAPHDFTPGKLRDTYVAVAELAAQGVPVGPETVQGELERRGVPGGHGTFVLTLYQNAKASDTTYWAEQVAAASWSRRLLSAGQRLQQLAATEPGDERDAEVAATLDALAAHGAGPAGGHERLLPGGGFVLDAPRRVPAVWGRGDDVLWAQGESLMVCGPSGTGKTTLAGQLVAGRLGLWPAVLGYPVAPGERHVLFLAMDRPAQAARALRRLFAPDDRAVLDDRLRVWTGPPPRDLARHPDTLVRLCERADADTVVVDSLKDAALGLSDDETGAGYNRARQAAIVAGVEVVELHHVRKPPGTGSAGAAIDGVYGSVWLVNGAGSVIVLAGAPGDPIVQLRHVKQPVAEVGPLQVSHDALTGVSAVVDAVDLVRLALGCRGGLTTRSAAAVLFDCAEPSQAEVEKARRRLDALVVHGLLVRKDGGRGGAAGGNPTTYHGTAADDPASHP